MGGTKERNLVNATLVGEVCISSPAFLIKRMPYVSSAHRDGGRCGMYTNS